MHLGHVLGMETYRDTANLVQGILTRTWQETFTTRDIWVVSFTLVTALLLIIVQTFNMTTARKRQINWTKVIMAIIFDILVCGLLIVGQLKVINWILDVRAPRQVKIERISPELVSVTWKTYDPEATLVYWGYLPNNLQNAELGINGSELRRDHEILLSTEPGRDVFLRLVVGRDQYGVNVIRGGEPYGIQGDSL